MIPGLCRERKIFTSDTIRHYLTDEWQSSREIVDRMFPGIKDYEVGFQTTKFARLVKVMIKHDEVESIDRFVTGHGFIRGRGYRMKQ